MLSKRGIEGRFGIESNVVCYVNNRSTLLGWIDKSVFCLCYSQGIDEVVKILMEFGINNLRELIRRYTQVISQVL